MSLTSKISTLVMGTANDLVDRLIDMNSPTMLKQAIRDLEDGQKQMNSDAVITAGGIRTLRREIGDIETRIADKLSAIKTVQAGTAANKETVARAYASSVISLKQQLKSKQDELDTQITDSAAMEGAIAKLDTKHDELVNALRRLESMDRQAKAKAHAAGALEKAASLSSVSDGISVDDIASKIQARNDVANEKFDRALKDPTFQDDPARGAEVDELLNSLK